ncbi:MAG: hypothetical protein AB7P34_19850 [Vicinamibacterales bacterium]
MGKFALPTFAQLDELRVSNDRRLIQGLLLTISIPAAVFAAIDLLGVRPGETSLESRLLGRALSLAVPLGGLWLIRKSRTREELSLHTFLITLSSVPVLIALQLQQPRGSSLVLTTLLLILAVMYMAVPNTLLRQALPPLLLTMFLVGARLWWLNGQTEAGLAADLVVLVFLNIIGIGAVRRRLILQQQVSASWRHEADAIERERQAHHRAEHARQQLQTLHGIIPICASCKQVRTDAGEWQQIERYVRDHSDAEFSHGVCPSCARRLYGEILDAQPADAAKAG